MEMDDEDYYTPSVSEGSEYSWSNGWTEKSSEEDENEEDKENSKSIKFVSKCKSEPKGNE